MLEQHEIDLINSETKQRQDTADYNLMMSELDDSVGVELLIVKEHFEKIVSKYEFNIKFHDWIEEQL